LFVDAFNFLWVIFFEGISDPLDFTFDVKEIKFQLFEPIVEV